MNIFKIAKKLIQIADIVDKFASRELISTVRQLVWNRYFKNIVKY